MKKTGAGAFAGALSGVVGSDDMQEPIRNDNEVLFLQILTIISLIFFINTINIITLWYLAGIYLFSLGFLMLLDDGDIFIGFL